MKGHFSWWLFIHIALHKKISNRIFQIFNWKKGLNCNKILFNIKKNTENRYKANSVEIQPEKPVKYPIHLNLYIEYFSGSLIIWYRFYWIFSKKESELSEKKNHHIFASTPLAAMIQHLLTKTMNFLLLKRVSNTVCWNWSKTFIYMRFFSWRSWLG